MCGGASRPFRPSTIRERIDSASVRITDTNYGQTAALSQCQVCGFVFADPVPHRDVLDLYRGMEDQPYQHSSVARRAQMRALLDVLSNVQASRPHAAGYRRRNRAAGSRSKGRGLDAQGIEPSRWCVATAASVNHVDLLCGTTQEWRHRLGRYDIVTLVDVIEHTTDPLGMLRDAAALLAPGGALLIVTPDIGSLAARLMGRWWWHHRVAHVGYFNRTSMRRALQEVRLTLEADTSATWRFPVSYLAERLVRYIPVFPISTLLRRARARRGCSDSEIGINLRDSRAFIASTGAASSASRLRQPGADRITGSRTYSCCRAWYWDGSRVASGVGRPAVALCAAVASACLVASSNYTINEWLDAPEDRNTPKRSSGRQRPAEFAPRWRTPVAVAGGCGSGAGAASSVLPFFWSAAALFVMGIVYNVAPLRSKDRPYIDALSESVNNPLRLLLGWYAFDCGLVPPASLLLAYWMLGAFFMSMKRFGELSHINDAGVAAAYRKSFRHYTPERLLISVVFYATAFGLFGGMFMIRYRVELILAVPFVAGLMAMYMHLGLLPDSPAQHPEALLRHKSFVAYGCLTTVVLIICSIVRIPWLDGLFQSTIPSGF